MAIRLGLSRTIGQGSTPAGELINTRGIAGTALWMGDAADFSEARGDVNYEEAFCGFHWYSLATHLVRRHWMLKLPALYSEFAGRSIEKATLRVRATGAFWQTASGIPDATQVYNIYVVRRAVDITDCTWTYFNASSGTWGLLGGGPDIDRDASPIASFEMDEAMFNTLAAGPDLWIDLDITGEWQRSNTRLYQLYLMMVPVGPKPAAWDPLGSRHFGIFFDDPALYAGVTHSHLEVVSQEPGFFCGTNPDGRINYFDYKVAGALDPGAWIDGGTPQAGGSGTPRATAVANATSDILYRRVVLGPDAYAYPVKQPLTGRRLRYVVPLNRASGYGLTDGKLRIALSSGSWRAYWTPAFGVEGGSPLVDASSATTFDFTSDHTLKIDGLLAFTIPAAAWETGVTLVGTEEWEVDLLGDIYGSWAQVIASYWTIAPYYGQFDASVFGGRSRTAPWTTHKTKLSETWCEQLWAASGMSSGKTTLTPRYCGKVVNGQRITVIEGSTIKHGFVESFTAHSSGAGGGVITCTTDLGATFTASAWVTTGVAIGDLAVRDRRRTIAQAEIGQSYIDLSAPLTATAGTIRIAGTTADGLTPVEETKTIASPPVGAPANRVYLTTALTKQFLTGSFVEVDVSPTDFSAAHSYDLFYLQLSPPVGTTDGEVPTFVRQISMALR